MNIIKVKGIYQILNRINNKVYIGSSINIKQRKSQHYHLLRTNNHPSNYLQKSWNKYGEHNFTFDILEEIFNEEELIKREQYWIDYKQSTNRTFGFNLCNASRRIGEWQQSLESKLKLSGEASKHAKLNTSQVLEIVKLLKNPLNTQEDIGKMFNVSADNISAIKNGISWGNIMSINKSSKNFPVRAISKKKENKYLGVYKSSNKDKEKNRFFVSIYNPSSKTKIHIGTYDDVNIAANAYNHAIHRILGEEAILNTVKHYVSEDACNSSKLGSMRIEGCIKKRKVDSGFHGVIWNGKQGKAGRWVAKFKDKQLGASVDKYECAKLYNLEAIKTYGKTYQQLNYNENGDVIL
ncbi:hypothetical protein BSK59_24860 [Paenibacillus odorifer]|uniref:GIY-YIG nuclease family protein n=1 Tax=Paenibacillus odorifer TaxID=189426 RepID=UPI00096F677E|nr:GIY-YIG nuclease family protein [Paenibacillus odorifer]OME49013.1 hypothetical protein BSK59_24860 [Paenibacillus odorifer]